MSRYCERSSSLAHNKLFFQKKIRRQERTLRPLRGEANGTYFFITGHPVTSQVRLMTSESTLFDNLLTRYLEQFIRTRTDPRFVLSKFHPPFPKALHAPGLVDVVHRV